MSYPVGESGYGVRVVEYFYLGLFSASGKDSPPRYKAEVYRYEDRKYHPGEKEYVMQFGAPKELCPERTTHDKALRDCPKLLAAYEEHFAKTGRHLHDDYLAARKAKRVAKKAATMKSTG